MKSEIVPFRGPDFSVLPLTPSRYVHLPDPHEPDKLCAVGLQEMAGVAITWMPGDELAFYIGNVKITMTVKEWDALVERIPTVIAHGRENCERLGLTQEPLEAAEL